MKILLYILTLLPCLAFGQTTLIPDSVFEQALIDLGYDTGTPDGSVPTANISGVTFLDVYNKNISDLTGIEDFTALTYLVCWSNQLTSLDVSNNTALTWLDCYYNQLTSLDVSNNIVLTDLYCGRNQLTSLDVSNNTALTTLGCWQNQLTSLDVSNNTALTYLHCGWNQLTSLDVSNNTSLTRLGCDSNQLTTLDVSNNTLLEIFDCDGNQLTSLDVSTNTALTYLDCDSNQLTSLDVSNNTALTWLDCDSNQLTCLNVKNGNNTNMTSFYATNNPNLSCIEVDNATWSTANWTNIDSQTSFSEDCNYPLGCFAIVGIEEPPTKPKELLYITDILGRTTLPVPNTLLFYIYEDGSVEKRIQLER